MKKEYNLDKKFEILKKEDDIKFNFKKQFIENYEIFFDNKINFRQEKLTVEHNDFLLESFIMKGRMGKNNQNENELILLYNCCDLYDDGTVLYREDKTELDSLHLKINYYKKYNQYFYSVVDKYHSNSYFFNKKDFKDFILFFKKKYFETDYNNPKSVAIMKQFKIKGNLVDF